MWARYPGHRWLCRAWILRLIADGAEHLEVRQGAFGDYVATEWYEGACTQPVSFSRDQARLLLSALVSFERWPRRMWATATRPLRRVISGRWSGVFDFPVGDSFLAHVSYHVVWRQRDLSELVVRVRGGPPLTEIARQELNCMYI
jgi:hypothetical protein